jgi:FkbM family methyltransferase
MTILNTRYGPMRVIDSDSVVSESLRLYGEWAQSEIDLLTQLVKPGDYVIDIGAFIGTHTIALANAAGGDGKVYSFEPRHEIFGLLSENIGLNKLDNVSPFNLGLSDSSATVLLESLNLESGKNFGGLALQSQLTEEGVSTYNVSVVTLDSLALRNIKLIKLDVEGMEGKVIRGARETIIRDRPLIFTECNSIAGGAEIMATCGDLDYSVFGCLSAAYNSENFNRVSENIFHDAMELGLLLIPCEKSAEIVSQVIGHQLLQVHNQDDLALLLLHKPQYILDILSDCTIGKQLGTDFSTPLSRHIKSVLTDCQNAFVLIEELARSRLKEIEELTARIISTESGLEKAQRLAIERLNEIEALNSRIIATDLALAEAQRMAIDRLREIEELNSRIIATDLALEKVTQLAMSRAGQKNGLPGQGDPGVTSGKVPAQHGQLSDNQFADCDRERNLPKGPQ